jgi:hypothetical protein
MDSNTVTAAASVNSTKKAGLTLSVLKSHRQSWNRIVSAKIASSKLKSHRQSWNRSARAKIASSKLKLHKCKRTFRFDVAEVEVTALPASRQLPQRAVLLRIETPAGKVFLRKDVLKFGKDFSAERCFKIWEIFFCCCQTFPNQTPREWRDETW